MSQILVIIKDCHYGATYDILISTIPHTLYDMKYKFAIVSDTGQK